MHVHHREQSQGDPIAIDEHSNGGQNEEGSIGMDAVCDTAQNTECPPIPMDIELDHNGKDRDDVVDDVDHTVDDPVPVPMDQMDPVQADPVMEGINAVSEHRVDRVDRERAEEERRENIRKELELQRRRAIEEKQRILREQQERDRSFRARFSKRQRAQKQAKQRAEAIDRGVLL